MSTHLVRPHLITLAPDSRVLSRRREWADPRSPYTTAALLITQHAQQAEDHATAEMAYAQAVGDGDAYDSWWAIRDAVADLQKLPGNSAP